MTKVMTGVAGFFIKFLRVQTVTIDESYTKRTYRKMLNDKLY